MGTARRQFVINGFTIIELLIVVAVIGILATIVTVAYGGIVNNARDKAVLSDTEVLDGIETHYGLTNGVSGKAWYSGNGSDPDLNFQPTDGNIIDIVIDDEEYCIRTYNPGSATYKTLQTAYAKGSTNAACSEIGPSAQALAASPVVNEGIVSTFAGSGTDASVDGTGTAAQFNQPWGIALASDGTMYVTENYGARIRKITPAGVVTTFAGSGTLGNANGTGTAAQFYYPKGIAIDSSGNLFVADVQNHRIRKITPAGVVTTFAGSTGGYVDATGTAARFIAPTDVAIDSSDNVYVADSNNNRIRKITPAGVVTTFAGSTSGSADGTGTAAQFYIPAGIAVDGSDNVYVADRFNNTIRKITPAGVVTTLAGSAASSGSADGTGAAAQFNRPGGIKVSSDGTVYVTDGFGNYLIRKITSAGVVTTLAGNGTGFSDGTGTAAQFNMASGLVIDNSMRLYVTDTYNHRIRLVQ